MIKEGFEWGEIMAQYPKLPKATLSGWFKQCQHISSESSKPGSEPPKLRLPIDPESPIEKVRNALWDVVHDPEGKSVVVQALNVILKSFEVEARLASEWGDESVKESQPTITVEFEQ